MCAPCRTPAVVGAPGNLRRRILPLAHEQRRGDGDDVAVAQPDDEHLVHRPRHPHDLTRAT
eukprot:1579441-Prymnesium_polylepis.1